LIIRLIIQTIRREPSRSDWIDEARDLSRPDPSGADQIDAEHQATDLAVWPTEATTNVGRRPSLRGDARGVDAHAPQWLRAAGVQHSAVERITKDRNEARDCRTGAGSLCDRLTCGSS
jgi:hypothetical protein